MSFHVDPDRSRVRHGQQSPAERDARTRARDAAEAAEPSWPTADAVVAVRIQRASEGRGGAPDHDAAAALAALVRDRGRADADALLSAHGAPSADRVHALLA